jgi:hypothetical protein
MKKLKYVKYFENFKINEESSFEEGKDEILEILAANNYNFSESDRHENLYTFGYDKKKVYIQFSSKDGWTCKVTYYKSGDNPMIFDCVDEETHDFYEEPAKDIAYNIIEFLQEKPDIDKISKSILDLKSKNLTGRFRIDKDGNRTNV